MDFHCSVACAASSEERLSEKIAMRMDGLPRWMREGMAAQGYTSFVACQRARAVPKKKGRLGSRPLQLPKIWVDAEDEDLLVRRRFEVWHEDMVR